jgi:hypothetical protein|tara:strand:+ start:2460 stop:2723 length:264 start_codon:yes stop_codon:yes gene_type:complete
MRKTKRIILFEEEAHGRAIESIFRFQDSTDLYKATVKRNMRWGSVFKWSDTNGWLHLVGTESFSDKQTIEDLMCLAERFHYEMIGGE